MKHLRSRVRSQEKFISTMAQAADDQACGTMLKTLLAPLWAVATLAWDVADVFASCALPRVTMVPPAQRLPRCALARVYTVEACARDLDARFISVNVTHTHAQNQSAAMILNINFPLRCCSLVTQSTQPPLRNRSI